MSGDEKIILKERKKGQKNSVATLEKNQRDFRDATRAHVKREGGKGEKKGTAPALVC